MVGESESRPGTRAAWLARALDANRGGVRSAVVLARAGPRQDAGAALLEVAERDFEAFDRSIDVHISSLRRKLGDDPKTPRFIQTIRGVGYMMLKPGVVAELP